MDCFLPQISSALSQVILDEEDAVYYEDSSKFPVGIMDHDSEQLDLRENNSWTKTLDHVSTVELMEVFAVNSIVPTLLVSKLRNLMKNSEGDKHIVNVTSPEGQFNTQKGSTHPHTNQAKAK